MDKFNMDEKIFCFILTTRSGGLGINLTGADTVVFYDTDWSYAFDLQAQDRLVIIVVLFSLILVFRVHRIGQRKEVHIYRLICESTVEQNILLKAQQKKQLDSLVMNAGKFSESSLLSAGSLRHLFGVDSFEEGAVAEENFQTLISAVEDEEDRTALKQMNSELEESVTELEDDSVIIQARQPLDLKEPDDESGDFNSLHNALKPVNRYSLSVVSLSEIHQRVFEFRLGEEDLADYDGSKHLSVQDCEDDLILALMTVQTSMSGSLFRNKRKQAKRLRLFRLINGDSWKRVLLDSVPFWYNEDTGEYSFETPRVLREKEILRDAYVYKYNCLPLTATVLVLSYLDPSPDRMNASRCCAKWRTASRDDSFYLRVFPVDDNTFRSDNTEQRVFFSLESALIQARAGETIILKNGHYWVKHLLVRFPVKIVCEDFNIACTLDVQDCVEILSKASFVGICFRSLSNRPLIIGNECHLMVRCCVRFLT
jgi:hypothetical protein